MSLRRFGATASMVKANRQNRTTSKRVFLMGESSKANIVAKATRDDTLPDTLSLGVEESYELAFQFWRNAQYGAARAMVWPLTRPKSAQSVDVIVGMTNFIAVIDWSAQDYDRARRTLASISPLVKTLRDYVMRGKYFNTRAMCERAAGLDRRAFAHYRDAIFCYERAGAHRYALDVDNNVAGLLIQQGEPIEAGRYIDKALHSCTEPLTYAQILDTRARQELAFGHYDEASQLVMEAIGYARKVEDSAVYLAQFAITIDDIRAAEVTQMEKSFNSCPVLTGRN